jgi:osmotically-inducible protein OsmY
MPVPRTASHAAIAAAFAALLATGTALSGCIVAAGGGAVAGYSVLGEDLSPEQQVRDYAIKAQVEASWGAYDQELAHRLDATVFDGQVLITGRVPDRRSKDEAARRAQNVKNVRRVFDEAEVGPDTHFIDDARDTWITTQLRSELVADFHVKSINYTIKTTDGVTYLLGFARTQPELDKVVDHARTVAGVRQVTPLVRVLEAADVDGHGEAEAMPPDEDADQKGAADHMADHEAPYSAPTDRGTIKSEPLP